MGNRPRRTGRALVEASLGLLRAHLARRPVTNPFRQYAARLPSGLGVARRRADFVLPWLCLRHTATVWRRVRACQRLRPLARGPRRGWSRVRGGGLRTNCHSRQNLAVQGRARGEHAEAVRSCPIVGSDGHVLGRSNEDADGSVLSLNQASPDIHDGSCRHNRPRIGATVGGLLGPRSGGAWPSARSSRSRNPRT